MVSKHLGSLVGALALSAVALVPAPVGAQAQPGGWISTWTASQQPPRGVMPASFSNQTVRQVVRVSLGGSKVRIRLSNEFGTKPVLIFGPTEFHRFYPAVGLKRRRARRQSDRAMITFMISLDPP